jgi:hypothetical protein
MSIEKGKQALVVMTKPCNQTYPHGLVWRAGRRLLLRLLPWRPLLVQVGGHPHAGALWLRPGMGLGMGMLLEGRNRRGYGQWVVVAIELLLRPMSRQCTDE